MQFGVEVVVAAVMNSRSWCIVAPIRMASFTAVFRSDWIARIVQVRLLFSPLAADKITVVLRVELKLNLDCLASYLSGDGSSLLGSASQRCGGI